MRLIGHGLSRALVVASTAAVGQVSGQSPVAASGGDRVNRCTGESCALTDEVVLVFVLLAIAVGLGWVVHRVCQVAVREYDPPFEEEAPGGGTGHALGG